MWISNLRGHGLVISEPDGRCRLAALSAPDQGTPTRTAVLRRGDLEQCALFSRPGPSFPSCKTRPEALLKDRHPGGRNSMAFDFAARRPSSISGAAHKTGLATGLISWALSADRHHRPQISHANSGPCVDLRSPVPQPRAPPDRAPDWPPRHAFATGDHCKRVAGLRSPGPRCRWEDRCGDPRTWASCMSDQKASPPARSRQHLLSHGPRKARLGPPGHHRGRSEKFVFSAPLHSERPTTARLQIVGHERSPRKAVIAILCAILKLRRRVCGCSSVRPAAQK